MESNPTKDAIRILASFLVVMASLILMSFMIAVAVQDSVRKNLRGDIDRLKNDLKVIHEQNEHSIDDRRHLETENQNTRESLQRLEKAVKTGKYP